MGKKRDYAYKHLNNAQDVLSYNQSRQLQKDLAAIYSYAYRDDATEDIFNMEEVDRLEGLLNVEITNIGIRGSNSSKSKGFVMYKSASVIINYRYKFCVLAD